MHAGSQPACPLFPICSTTPTCFGVHRILSLSSQASGPIVLSSSAQSRTRICHRDAPPSLPIAPLPLLQPGLLVKTLERHPIDETAVCAAPGEAEEGGSDEGDAGAGAPGGGGDADAGDDGAAGTWEARLSARPWKGGRWPDQAGGGREREGRGGQTGQGEGRVDRKLPREGKGNEEQRGRQRCLE